MFPRSLHFAQIIFRTLLAKRKIPQGNVITTLVLLLNLQSGSKHGLYYYKAMNGLAISFLAES